MKKTEYQLVLLRHGESIWNREDRFTGWTDVDLTETGIKEAQRAALLLKELGYQFDIVYTSVLKRCIRTVWILLEQMGYMWLPVEKSWRLNERHYGALQGLNKAQTAMEFGENLVTLWRRSYAVRPPALDRDDPRFPGFDARYHHLDPKELPLTESLKDTVQRLLPYWINTIVPSIQSGKKVLIVAHGNSLRALIKHLNKLSDQELVDLRIPTGNPQLFQLDNQLNVVSNRYIGTAPEKDMRR